MRDSDRPEPAPARKAARNVPGEILSDAKEYRLPLAERNGDEDEGNGMRAEKPDRVEAVRLGGERAGGAPKRSYHFANRGKPGIVRKRYEPDALAGNGEGTARGAWVEPTEQHDFGHARRDRGDKLQEGEIGRQRLAVEVVHVVRIDA